MLFRKLLTLIIALQAYTLTAHQISMSLSPAEQTVVAGQPVIEILTIKNESSDSVILWNDREHLPIEITGPSGRPLTVPQPPPPLETLTFGKTIAPWSTESIEIAVLGLANASDTGDYVVTFRAADLGVSTDCHVFVQPYDADILDQWALETTEEITKRPQGLIFELVKALCSLRPDIAEPYLCRLMTQSKIAAIPAVVDRLEELNTTSATKCLIASLPIYSDEVDRQYIIAALKAVEKKSNNAEIRGQIQAALAEQEQK